eukprot:TRINITY_DN6140_c0_g2_i1.p1 TRINITY_DN6140_c0_g2~~TRINITY_DN6140_c0_g2_i1.p1  ORF type:complete len:872 (+),score=370.08 TRINITY_DN6140_c0_g2_i1:91-2706(+)
MGDNVRVMARFRPMNRLEKEEGGREVVTFQGDTTITIEPTETGAKDKHTFNFDHIFGPDSMQKSVYDQVGVAVVADVFKGYNGTIFVYGQTGSGKSHTMMGPSSDELRGYCDDEHLKGIIPRVVDQIFLNVEKADPNIEFSIKVSYVEIYMEKVRDLFAPEKANLQLHEDFKGGRGVYIQNVTEEWVGGPDEIFSLMRQGASNRAVASTRMNADSSRSHSIFQLTIQQKHSVKLDQVTGKLFLVDLAGSEKVGKTGAQGQQLEEAKLINKSLSCLGLVINALTDPKAKHIPYRDSKLTRLLQDSLGGNARTSLIICGSVSEYNQHETLSTLRFGQRAKSIKNKAKVNRELSIGEYKLLVARLERTIAELRVSKGLPESVAVTDAAAVEQIANLEAQLENERGRWLDDRTELQDDLQAMREKEGLKDALLEQYRQELAAAQEEIAAWEAESLEVAAKVDELGARAEAERRAHQEQIRALRSAHGVLDQFGKDTLGVKVTLQKLRAHLEQQTITQTDTALDGAQQEQVAAWRRERDAARQEDQVFKSELRQKVEAFGALDTRGAQQRAEELRALRAQIADAARPCWLRHCIGGGAETEDEEPMPDGAEASAEEIRALRRAVRELRKGDSVPRAAFDEAKECFRKELAQRMDDLARMRKECDIQLQDSDEVRRSLLQSMQQAMEKSIDLDGELDDLREEYKQLQAASSNKQLGKRVKLLEEQLARQTEQVEQLMQRKSQLEMDLAVAVGTLEIRSTRIEDLRKGFTLEKQYRTQELEKRSQIEAKLSKEIKSMREELAQRKEEAAHWRDKYAACKELLRAQQQQHGGSRIAKVLRGGKRQDRDRKGGDSDGGDALASSLSVSLAAHPDSSPGGT